MRTASSSHVAMIELMFRTMLSFCLFPKRQECHSQNGIRGQKEAKRSGQIITGTDSEADKGFWFGEHYWWCEAFWIFA